MQNNAHESTRATPRRALVVEEHAADRELGVSVLSQLDFRVETAPSAQDALARLAGEPVALVLLSSTLPDMAASELAEKLRHLAGATPPAIVVVAAKGQDPALPSADTGIMGHVSRPLTCRAIEQLVEAAETPQGSGAQQEPVVDMDHLLSFTDGDLELESELSVLFLSSAEAYFDKMRRCLHAGTPWTSSAHALKGASANLGARRLAALARSAEHQPPTAADLQKIRRAIDEVSAFFRERQRTHGKEPGP